MLAVQRYLNEPGNTLDTLYFDYAIKVKHDERLGVVCLNYDQIESPENSEIVQDCRGLILELNTWKLKCLPFRRFFNLGQSVGQEFDWRSFKAFPKLDGSLISFWHHDSLGWQIATRGVPDASGPVDATGMTFRDLVIKAMWDNQQTFGTFTSKMDPGFTYHFELTSPENQVVVAYAERSLTLINIRNVETLEEVNLDLTQGFPKVSTVGPFASPDELIAAANRLNPSEAEGFVVRDWMGHRLKIKSEAYCLANKCRDRVGASRLNQLELIFSVHLDDAFHLLPKHIQVSIGYLKDDVHFLCEYVAVVWNRINHLESQKEFALQATKFPFSGILFDMRKKGAIRANYILAGLVAKNSRNALDLIDKTSEIIFKTKEAV